MNLWGCLGIQYQLDQMSELVLINGFGILGRGKNRLGIMALRFVIELADNDDISCWDI